MKNIFVKYANIDIEKELNAIGFDSSYLGVAKTKYGAKTYKIFNLRPVEANILKQLCLSLGFDCAVSRNTITCSCEYTDALICATDSQLNKLKKKLVIQPFRLKELANYFVCNSTISPLKVRNYTFDWSRQCVMGILNVTPDSFSDGGKYIDVDVAVKRCIELVKDGADIIDIGGESTRPDANKVSVEEEVSRIIPVIKAIRENNIDIPISIDTRNYDTAVMAINNGADIINDVSGFCDENLFRYVTENNIPSIVVHSNKIPADINDFSNNDVVEDIYVFLKEKTDSLINAGLSKENIIVDVGVGFGKSQESNFEILRRISEFKSLELPILLGISRKSFIRNKFNLSIDESDVPTVLYSSMLKDVNIHRVHNVSLTKKYLNFSSFI